MGNKKGRRHCGIARKVGRFKKHSLRASGRNKTTKKLPKNFNKNKMTALKVFAERHVLKQQERGGSPQAAAMKEA